MDYSELFDGEENWLGEGDWVQPDLRILHVVENEVQGRLTPLETASTNLVPSPDRVAALTWGVEGGWSAFAVMMQQIGELLSPGGDNQLVAEEHVVRDDKWAVKSKHYKVWWKGSPDDVEGI